MSSEGLKELKKKDSFLYFSIPQVWSASVLHKGQVSSGDDEDGQAQRVVRQTRLSTECHPDLLIEDILLNESLKDSTTSLSMDECSDNEEQCPIDDEEDLFLSFLNMTVKANESRKRKVNLQ